MTPDNTGKNIRTNANIRTGTNIRTNANIRTDSANIRTDGRNGSNRRKRAGLRILTVITLTFVILAGLFAFRTVRTHSDEPSPSETNIGPPEVLESLDIDPGRVTDWSHVIAYVPLDDRTDNLEDMVYLAEASGYRLVMPPHDWYRTALDGQPLNTNGTQYGNREALLEWVRDMDLRGCDLFILSLDQLFSGGLVNSRSISTPQTFTFSNASARDGFSLYRLLSRLFSRKPDTVSMTEKETFDAWILPLADDPRNRVYLFDSVTRLSPTVGYDGLSETDYYALRAYGMTARPTLSDEELTLEGIFAAYPYAADGVTPAQDTLPDRWRENLTPEKLQEYLNVRRRKLSLLDTVITAVLNRADGGKLRLLIGIDDSSSTENIQYNELRYIRKRLGDGTALMAGLDSLARLLVGQLAQQEYDYQIRASVRYIGGSQNIPSSEFDLYTLQQVVNLHMDMFQARIVPEEQAELQFVVITAPDDASKAAEYVEEAAALLENNLTRHIPTVLDEASNNAYGDALEQALLSRVDFAGLVAYAGKYDQANVTGAAFAMGFSRYLYLRCRSDKNPVCDAAHARQMANSMALTEYILHTREPLNDYVEGRGVNRNNMSPDALSDGQILRKLEELFAPECEKVCGNLRGTGLLSDIDPWTEREIREIVIQWPYFPWRRTFEISFTVTAELEPFVTET